jgi:hypothetical protein
MMSAEWQPTRSHRISLKGLKRITPADVDSGRFSVAPSRERRSRVGCAGGVLQGDQDGVEPEKRMLARLGGHGEYRLGEGIDCQIGI